MTTPQSEILGSLQPSAPRVPRKLKICSWDVGIYNLSYCILEKDEDRPDAPITILKWDIVNLVDNESQKKNRPLLFQNIPIKLNAIPELLAVDYVFIENQPSLKNPQMKSIQMILYSYFLMYGMTDGILIEDEEGNQVPHKIKGIDFCSASNKLKVYNGPAISVEDIRKPRGKAKVATSAPPKTTAVVEEGEEGESIVYHEEKEPTVAFNPKSKTGGSSIKYSDKKKLAIAHAMWFLQRQDPAYTEFFQSHKKRDDLADSFLQGVYVFEKILVSTPTPKVSKSKATKTI